MYIFKKENVDLLVNLLFDAEFIVKDLPKEIEENCFTLNIRRPYWEKSLLKKMFFLNITKVKAINSNLTINNISNIKYNWKDDAFNSGNDIHSILGITYIDRKIIIKSEYLIITIELKKEYIIVLKDLSTEPEKKNFLNIIGKKRFDYKEWLREYNNKIVKNNN